MSKAIKAFLVLAVVSMFAVTTMAFAGRGRGMGPDGRGPGWGQRGGCPYGQSAYGGNLSDEEIAKVEEQRAQFFAETEDIRQKLYEKDLALRSELVKENPDNAVAMALQKEISGLQSDLEQKRLDHELKTRKLVPNYTRGWGNGMMMGRGCGGGGGYCMR